MKIESSDRKIDELLKGNTFFIPRFQRAYSWEAEQIGQFWSDIIDNINDSYFIGSIVVYKRGRSSLALVDGQQRLTTITILLCAIRESYKKLGNEELANGLQAYIEQRTRDNKTVYVLETETSFPYLQEEVLKNSPADAPYDFGSEEEAISRAYSLFKDKIKESLDPILDNKERTGPENIEQASTFLSALRDAVFDLNVIVVTLDNEDDAYLIFETLNTRGKDLALSDLIRNHFTKFLKPTSGVDHATLKWGKVLETISSAPLALDADTFIVHSWQSRYDFVTKAKVFPRVKSLINSKNAKDHLNRFMSDSEHWRSIFDQEFKWGASEKDVKRSLRALRIFKVIQPTPGLLSLVRAYHDEIIKYGRLRDSISMIEKFHFSFNAVTSSRSSGGISGMYSSFGRQVFSAKDAAEVVTAISELKSKLRDREPDADEFRAGFNQIVYTKENSSQKALVQYILRKIAAHEMQPFIGETDDLTIEHLIPQASRKSGSKDSDIGRLGNLILIDTKTNDALANKDFKEKKKILTAKGYKLPDLLLNANELTSDIISKNTLRIAELARDVVWKV
ncbi:DUF262 domain-containing HNH endonuclease family protein [Paracoccus sp. APAP_BH8]|uniref:DUF262 domain-containing protein n=1 Tax=Paracoccus sp. APAP_BH8 TaxID=3110237 RepID=UPI002FD85BE1